MWDGKACAASESRRIALEKPSTGETEAVLIRMTHLTRIMHYIDKSTDDLAWTCT
jgi:hypothetical protein